MAVAVKISAKKSAFRWRTGRRRLHLQYQHKPEPPPRARYEGVDVGGNPPVISGIERKTKTGNKLKRP
ncbi:hypothetical protein E0Y07_18110 [Salmonella enterica subsp. enterica serovar Bredeney]|nr:hypothetical protein [Salmonella enterica subsp. enterica serovar Bredeney]